jgi:hypothetical protein
LAVMVRSWQLAGAGLPLRADAYTLQETVSAGLIEND